MITPVLYSVIKHSLTVNKPVIDALEEDFFFKYVIKHLKTSLYRRTRLFPFVNCFWIAYKSVFLSNVSQAYGWGFPQGLQTTWLFLGSNFFFSLFSSLIYMMPKICSQGYHFSCGCLQKRRAQRIYLLDPSHKDNELQNSGVQLGVLRVGTPSHPQASF